MKATELTIKRDSQIWGLVTSWVGSVLLFRRIWQSAQYKRNNLAFHQVQISAYADAFMATGPQVEGLKFDSRRWDAVDNGFCNETKIKSKIVRLENSLLLFDWGVLANGRDRIVRNEHGAVLGERIVEGRRTFDAQGLVSTYHLQRDRSCDTIRMMNADLYATNQPVQEGFVRGSGRVTRKEIYKIPGIPRLNFPCVHPRHLPVTPMTPSSLRNL